MQQVSIVIPTRDRPEYLSVAIRSIGVAADHVRDRASVEVLVVDNSSTAVFTEQARAVAAANGARFVCSSPPGVSRARNLGIRTATGVWVGFLDDDDGYLPDCLDRLLDLAERHPTAGMVFGQQILCDSGLVPVFGPVPGGPFPTGEALAFSMATIVGWNPVLARRDVLLELGGFDESIAQSEDWDLQMRLASRYDMVGIEQPVALIRQHPRPPLSFDRWLANQRECRVVELRGRSLEGREHISWPRRWASTWRHRGRSAHGALSHAATWVELGDLSQARRFVLGACWRSFPHTLRLGPSSRGVIWGTLRSTRRSGRSASALHDE